MLVHGTIWAWWMDEYMKWKPADYNSTQAIYVQPWRIWQPALSLYNSARSDHWYIYMNGQPHYVASSGDVTAAGTFR